MRRFFYLPLLIPAVLLLGGSLLMLSSISEKYLYYQSAWIFIGLLIFAALQFFDWRPFIHSRYLVGLMYVAIIALLVLTLLFAPSIRGNRAWLVIGPVQFQASEFAKAILILVLAYFLGRHHASIGNLKTIFYSLALAAPLIVLVMLEPDLGSAMVIAALWCSLVVLSGLRPKHLFMALLLAVVAIAVAWFFFLAPYQKERVVGLFNPASDPQGVNYSVIQSKIAIGSAGFWGKGYRQGSQVQLGFLPESLTDFIYPAFVEEWGIFGGFIITTLFMWLIFSILRVGVLAEANFEKFVCLGCAVILGLHFVINIGSSIGFLPVIGVPLPLMSYGGSNLISNIFLLGIVNSIGRRVA